MKVLGAIAIAQGVLMLANTQPIRKVRQIAGNWITPYPTLQTQKDMEETVNKSLDVNDMIINERLAQMDNNIKSLRAALDEIALRLCDVVVGLEEKEKEVTNYEEHIVSDK